MQKTNKYQYEYQRYVDPQAVQAVIESDDEGGKYNVDWNDFITEVELPRAKSTSRNRRQRILG